ncbi:unnamed protein product [Pleuronectes platessa]|uniref:PDZ domain-containing protein n=1 Tax=Pleuronectes platessa TaxID=8262 RepID=A0A9N7UCA9_PLEPL|nr:unnamed protein product [Pleuronectes platessa]
MKPGLSIRGWTCPPLSSLTVLSCLSADTPIEEFTPTAAFPALQYLESVDEGGVAWQAGLRTGDFLIEQLTPPTSHVDSDLLGEESAQCHHNGMNELWIES